MTDLGAVIAIDLGTTHTRVARFNGKSPELILIDGEPMMPSVVTIVPEAMAEEGEERFKVGAEAVEAATRSRALRPWMMRHIKRHRGEKWNDDEASGDGLVQGNDDFEFFKADGMTHYQGPDGHTYSPIELESALLHKALKAAEERYKGRKIKGAVLTVPAESTPTQRRALEAAAREAGLEYIEIMDEPTAAALVYGHTKRQKKRKVICVWDVGGGTSDCAIIEVGGDHVKMLGTGCSSVTGGVDFDRALSRDMLDMWMADHPDSDVSGDDSARSLLLSEAEEAKKRLSRKAATEFRIDDFDKSPHNVDRPLVYEVTREKLESISADELDRMEKVCNDAIAEARRNDPKFSVADIHDVVLVGGGTKMPAVQAVAARVFAQEPKSDIDPESAVVLGAAIQAAISEGLLSEVTMSRITPFAIRIETHDKVMGVATPIFEKGTPYPTREPFARDLVNREAGQTSMPVRILLGNNDRAMECDVLHSFNFQIDAGAAQSQRVPFEIALNSRGEPYGIVGGESFGEAL